MNDWPPAPDEGDHDGFVFHWDDLIEVEQQTVDRCRPYGIARPEVPPDDEATDVAAWLATRFDDLAADASAWDLRVVTQSACTPRH